MFPQKFNSLELSIVENGGYRINRMETTGRSIAYLKETDNIAIDFLNHLPKYDEARGNDQLRALVSLIL